MRDFFLWRLGFVGCVPWRIMVAIRRLIRVSSSGTVVYQASCCVLHHASSETYFVLSPFFPNNCSKTAEQPSSIFQIQLYAILTRRDVTRAVPARVNWSKKVAERSSSEGCRATKSHKNPFANRLVWALRTRVLS